jgi:hypothetical protein
MNKEVENQEHVHHLSVYVINSRGGEIASKVRGYFIIDDLRFPFSALDFGRIGGHNIHLKLAKTTYDALRKKSYNPEWVELKIQQKLIEGDIILPTEMRQPEK